MIAVLVAAGGAYAYHRVLVSDLESQVASLEATTQILRNNQNQLKTAVDTAKDTIAKMEANAAEQARAITSLTQTNNELNQEKQRYLKIFKDHNLTRLARAKPGMIETRINRGTAQVFRDLENDTKEIMSAAAPRDTDGVRSTTTETTTRTGNNNGSGESPSTDIPTASPSGN